MAKANQQITAKQEKACQVFIETGCKSTAYRAGYNTTKMKAESVHRKAVELFETDMVTARVAELQAEHRKVHNVTVEKLTEQLDSALKLAHKEGQPGAAVSAITATAKLHGLMIDRSKVETTATGDLTDEEFEAAHRRIEIEHVRMSGRGYLVEKLAKTEHLLALYDAGKFEEYAAQGDPPTKH
ncbi:MAG: hypothetical protein O7G83_02190 [Proteobacteria bacterium]|nr:hypothetical protein [Pseudomonadota bacterium]